MPEDFDPKLKAVERLLVAFKMERTLYVIISTLSVLMLLGTSVWMFTSSDLDALTFLGLFVPAGGITYSIGRLLKMWNQAIAFIAGQNQPDADK